MAWETVIGLEVHVQLMTRSKIFSGASTAYGAAPNTQACAIDLGLPGVLPVLNQQAVDMAIKFGLATGCEINKRSVFARKNYFYPDLPKGYQISQFEIPIVGKGTLDILMPDESFKTIGVTRAHLEEDAGKSLHGDSHGLTGVDLNRAGTPLLEIVSEPDMRSAEEAIAYLKTLHSLVRYLEICDGNMQEGSFRCDANISVRPAGQKELGTRCEIKNVNSFRFVEKAINYEVQRQIELIEDGGTVTQQTRLYDSQANVTRPMRSKEEANDYRYFPDPDLLPLILTHEEIETIKKSLPELPRYKRARFVSQYNLRPYDAAVLTGTRELADFYEEVLKIASKDPKIAANWVMGEFLGALNKANLSLDQSPLTIEQFAGLLKRIMDNTISGKTAKTVFEILWENGGDADSIIEEKGLKQVTDSSAIEKLVDEALAAHPTQVADYKAGKTKMMGFFVGQIMKASKGTANPGQVNQILKDKLG